MVVDVRRRGAATVAEHERLDLVFQALSDQTRRDIVGLVMGDELSVSDLARRYPMSFAAVQKHVAVLERASLVTKRNRGRERLVRGRIDAVRDIARMFDQLETTWRNRLDRFGDVLVDPEREPEPAEKTAPKFTPKTKPTTAMKRGAKR